MNHTYYENPDLWAQPPEPYMVQVRKDVLTLLPRDAESLLDVGCGHGFITNALPPEVRVVGLDIAAETLRYVEREACRGDIVHLPFADDAFDVVMANDVIEHVVSDQYAQALAELFRVARRYVIVTVPFLEDLAASHIRCGACGHVYHRNQHQRMYGMEQIDALALGRKSPWQLGPVVLSGVEWNEEPYELTRLRQGLGAFAHAAYPHCPRCDGRAETKSILEYEDSLRAMSTYLSAKNIAQQIYALCRTEAICLLYRETPPPLWRGVAAQAVRHAADADLYQPVEIDPLQVDFRVHPEWYRKTFLPSWGSRAYFYIDDNIRTTSEGLALAAGEDVKIGFFSPSTADVIVEGAAAADTVLEVRIYGTLGYQFSTQVEVDGDFCQRLTDLFSHASTSPYGRLLAITCAQGSAVLHACRYTAEAPRQTWQVRRSQATSSDYLALSSSLLLSTRYYETILPTPEAASQGIRSRTQWLTETSPAAAIWQVVGYLEQNEFISKRQMASQVEHIQQRLQQVNSDSGTLAMQHRMLQDRQDVFSDTFETQEQALQDIKNSLASNNNTLQRQQDDLKGRLTTFREQFDAMNHQIVSLQKNYSDLHEQYTKLESQQTTLQDRYNILQDQYAALQGQYTAVHERHAALEAPHESLQTEYDALQSQLLMQARALEQVETQLTTQSSRIMQLEGQLSILEQLVSVIWHLRQHRLFRFVWQRLRGVRQMVTRTRRQPVLPPVQPDAAELQPSDVEPMPWKPQTAVMLVPDNRIDRRVLLEARSLVQAGWQVTVVGAPPPTPDYRLDEDLFPEVTIIRVNASQVVQVPSAWQSPFVPSGEADWSDFYWLTNHFYLAAVQQPVQVVVAHDLPVLPAAVMAAARHQAYLVYDAHELYPEQHPFSPEQVERYRRAEAILAKFPHQVITVNQSIAHELAKRYGIAEPAVILNCPDLEPEACEPSALGVPGGTLREVLAIPEEKKILLFQGGLSPHRNLENLVSAMAWVTSQEVVLVLMGPGEEMRLELERMAEAQQLLGTRVFFHPPVQQDQLVWYSSTADAGIIPYPHVDLNSYYCTPNKLFDFLVAGIPILANDSPELRKFVADQGVGMVHAMADAQEIAKSIDTFFAMEHASLRETAQVVGKDYTWANQGREVVALYESMIHNMPVSRWSL